MEQIINNIFQTPDLENCTVEYYPHVIVQYKQGGVFKNENITKLDIKKSYETTDTITEYVHREKKFIVHKNGDREYLKIQQKINHLSQENGLFVVSKIECIDPNKFPVLSQYYDISKKTIKMYDGKYTTTSIITEDDLTYIKLSFSIVYDDIMCKKIIKNLKELISLLQ
jgi:hypothetical protein